jgi:hypothetical protein
MAELTETQRTAQRLAHEIGKLGGFVVSLPLANPIRFQVLEPSDAIINTLREWGWQPTRCGAGLRFCPDGARPCTTYQVDLGPERQDVPTDNRRIPDAVLASSEPKSSYEVEQVMRYLGMAGKK